MPRISEFYGIAVYMYYADHNPPHFHAFYGSAEAAIAIADGEIIAGEMPRRARKLLSEWLSLHQDDLLDDWRRAASGEPLVPIEPLD